MSSIRPAPPIDYTDARNDQIGKEINNLHLVAGKGISISKTGGGTTIGLSSGLDPELMNFQGTYAFEKSYQVGDVVFVDPYTNYTDQNGDPIPTASDSSSTLPPIVPGLYVCSFFVPCAGQDSDMLTGNVEPAFADVGQTITNRIADQYRHYDLNVYYPICPRIPDANTTYATQSSWSTIANNNYWYPLAPLIKLQICTDGVTVTNAWLCGFTTNSFDLSLLPYQP